MNIRERFYQKLQESREQLDELAPTMKKGSSFDFRNMLTPPKKKSGGGGPPSDDTPRKGGGGGGPSHAGAVRIVRDHFKAKHGVGPDVTGSGDGDNQVTIVSHPKIKHEEYSVMDDGDGTQVIYSKNKKNGGQNHKVVEVNWNMNSLGKH